MTKPVRLQLSRRKGFDLQAASHRANGLEAVNVARPGPWGNDFRVWCDDDQQWTVSYGSCHWQPSENTKEAAAVKAVELYRAHVSPDGPQHYRGFDNPPTQSDIIKGLRGKNLACWCKRADPCHADVLLELANSLPKSEAA